jgi:signal peptidase
MEPAYSVGDMVFVKIENADNINVGDVITFNPSSDGAAYLTHRVVEKLPDYQGSGTTCFKTKGDANDSEDTFLIDEERVIGVVRFKIPFMGYVVRFVQMRWYFIVPIIALIFVFFKLMGIYLAPSKKKAIEETTSENGEASSDSPPAPETASASMMATDTETASAKAKAPAQTEAPQKADGQAADKADDSSKK